MKHNAQVLPAKVNGRIIGYECVCEPCGHRSRYVVSRWSTAKAEADEHNWTAPGIQMDSWMTYYPLGLVVECAFGAPTEGREVARYELAERQKLLTGAEWWERWDRIAPAYLYQLDSRRVPCPKCEADVGVKCKRPSGHSAWDAHAERWDAALYDAERKVPLPGSKTAAETPLQEMEVWGKFRDSFIKKNGGVDPDLVVEVTSMKTGARWLAELPSRKVEPDTRKKLDEKGYVEKYLRALRTAKFWLPYLHVPGVPAEFASDSLVTLIVDYKLPVYVIYARHKYLSSIAFQADKGEKVLQGGSWSHWVSLDPRLPIPGHQPAALQEYGFEIRYGEKPSYLDKMKSRQEVTKVNPKASSKPRRSAKKAIAKKAGTKKVATTKAAPIKKKTSSARRR